MLILISNGIIYDCGLERCIKESVYKNTKGWIEMTYTADVKKKLDDILKAFSDHIDNQSYFDILYSKKVGYLWVVVDPPSAAGAELLDTPEAMLDNLFNDVIEDVIAPRENSGLDESPALTEREEAEVRRQLTAILEKIEDGGAEYLKYLDKYIRDYQERFAGGDGSC